MNTVPANLAGSHFRIDGLPIATSAQWQTSGNDIYYDAGNVAIGTTPQSGYKLVVCGSIRAHKIVVETFTCDFVFDKKYQLLSLTERKQKVLENKHLINVPSAKDMDKNGNDLGNTMMGILQNVEEHELYLYEHEQKIFSLKSDNNNLKTTIAMLQASLEEQKQIIKVLQKEILTKENK